VRFCAIKATENDKQFMSQNIIAASIKTLCRIQNIDKIDFKITDA